MDYPVNPFVTLEAVMEHVQNARYKDQTTKQIAYHLEAVEERIKRLFQTLVLLLPGAYASYEGEPTDTILDQIGGESR